MTKLIILALLGAATGCSASKAAPEPIPDRIRAVILRDRSRSDSGGCASTVGLLGKAMRTIPLGNKGAILVVGTGDAETANEPKEIARYALGSHRMMEGHAGVQKRANDALVDAWTKCGDVKATNRSPLYLSLDRALEQVREPDCDPRSCLVYFQTDLEEQVEAGIKKAVAAGENYSGDDLPPILDNAGISVLLCGYSETLGTVPPKGAKQSKAEQLTPKHTAARVARLRSVWLGLFSHPELVRLEPFCPKWTPPTPVLARPPARPTGARIATNQGGRGP